ncbi:MAG TPA: Gfo/Idh/MocA family oxidoreductase, partial [Armatimonadota bacterium]
MNRREFLVEATAAAAGAIVVGASGPARAASPSERVVLGVMGVNGRGRDLAQGFAKLPDAEIAYLCDVDQRALDRCAAALSKSLRRAPKLVTDFRRILEDPGVDALVVATPDHWHAPATILACQAGKHVYCEKPASHNPWEGEQMVAAARKHQRVVQIGSQRRSMPGVIEAVQRLQEGAIGRVLFAKGTYNNARASIGHGKVVPVPAALNYPLWEGPAPELPYKDNLIHYNWHWFWHWGTGELGNNGIHALDVCRWGLGVTYPERVTAGGGKYCHDDDQETPDTYVVTYDYGDKGITWEARSWHPRAFEGQQFGIVFYGDQGTLLIEDGGYRILDKAGKETAVVKAPADDQPHKRDFLSCVRTGERPKADVEVGVASTLLCHLGNIAYRTGHVLNTDP